MTTGGGSADLLRAAAAYLDRLTDADADVRDAVAYRDQLTRDRPPEVTWAQVAAALRVTPRGLRKRLGQP